MSEVDIKWDKPWKLWGMIGVFTATMSGGSGTVSYTLAQQATADMAEKVAMETVDGRLNESLDEINQKIGENSQAIKEINEKLGDQRDSTARTETDIRWIKDTLTELRRQQNEQRPVR